MSWMTRRRFVGLALAHASIVVSAGCGTVLHPERRGQPAGPIDWKIVALDAVGLLLFFIPGVIAFAVDFSNGTIYLPTAPQPLPTANIDQRKLLRVTVDEPMTIEKVEQVVSQHAEREVHLLPGSYQTEELNHIDDFWEATDKYATSASSAAERG